MLMLSRHMKLKGENSSSMARSLLRCLALPLGNVDWRGEVELASGASIQARVCEFNVWDSLSVWRAIAVEGLQFSAQ